MDVSNETHVDRFDFFRYISSIDKGLVRVGAKTFPHNGTYKSIKLYKKDENGTFKKRQGIILSTGGFESLADNYTKIKDSNSTGLNLSRFE